MKKTTLLIILFHFISICLSQKNMSVLGTLNYSEDLNDIWAYVDFAGNEFALVGVHNGVSVVDLSDKANPVEIHFIPGPESIWRDLKTWSSYAYVTNESDSGLLVIDMSGLPSTVNYRYDTLNGLRSAHNLFIDENGYMYIFGSNIGFGGAQIYNLLNDPWSPQLAGSFDQFYIHDGMVRGDTMWAGAVYDGVFAVIDVSVKTSPVVLGTHSTPHQFTHNCWISDDGNYLFTTDEVNGAFLTSYDVTNMSNIKELDRIQSNPGSSSAPHNTHVIGDFLVTSWYKDGVTIVDATYPEAMVEVGYFDTSPLSGPGFDGNWGAYPWLPSGAILVTDQQEGLFILSPSYVQGCYVQGTVTDASNASTILNARFEILSSGIIEFTDISGQYFTGVADAGFYTVVCQKPGYYPDTIANVSLAIGQLITLDIDLDPLTPFTIDGLVKTAVGGIPISDASIRIQNGDFTYDDLTDGTGSFQITPFYEGSYEITAGKWGYTSSCMSLTINTLTGNVEMLLDSGIYDDFTFDFGWATSGNVQSGAWERGEPRGTTYFVPGDSNPDNDVSDDCSDQALVTGNQGIAVFDDDVDDGETVVTSPAFDLSLYSDPYIHYDRWFFNAGGWNPPNDTLRIKLNNGITTILIDSIKKDGSMSMWNNKQIRISDFIMPTSQMKLIVATSDYPNAAHIVEAGFDNFMVVDSGQVNVKNMRKDNKFIIFPNPFVSEIIVDLKEIHVQELSIQVYDRIGRLIENKEYYGANQRVKISMNNVKPGIYLLRLKDSNGTIGTTHLLKRH